VARELSRPNVKLVIANQPTRGLDVGSIEYIHKEIVAMRDRGVLARQVDDGAVENVYRLQVMNASLQPRQLHLQALAGDAASSTALQVQHRGGLSVDAAGATTWVVTVRMSAEQAQRHPRGTPVPIRLVVDDRSAGVQAQTTTTFLTG
jgi:hypothetical protein